MAEGYETEEALAWLETLADTLRNPPWEEVKETWGLVLVGVGGCDRCDSGKSLREKKDFDLTEGGNDCTVACKNVSLFFEQRNLCHVFRAAN